MLIKLTTQVILLENEGDQFIFKGRTRSWKITKQMQIYYICHTLPAWLQGHRRFRIGQKSLCLLFLYVQCQLRMNWTPTDDIRLLLWQRFDEDHVRPFLLATGTSNSITNFLYTVSKSSLPHLKMFCLGTCSIKATEVLSMSSGKGCSTSPT